MSRILKGSYIVAEGYLEKIEIRTLNEAINFAGDNKTKKRMVGMMAIRFLTYFSLIKIYHL